jgi:plasmid maintenance system killer protein
MKINFSFDTTELEKVVERHFEDQFTAAAKAVVRKQLTPPPRWAYDPPKGAVYGMVEEFVDQTIEKLFDEEAKTKIVEMANKYFEEALEYRIRRLMAKSADEALMKMIVVAANKVSGVST